MSPAIIFKEFIYGGHIQSMGAASIIYVTSVLFVEEISFEILLLAYLLFLPIYIYNRYKEFRIDRITNPERTAHYALYVPYTNYILALLLVLLLVLLYYQDNFPLTIYSSLVLILGFMYTLKFKRLTQHIIAFKNIYVALVFGSLVYMYALYSNMTISIEVVILMIFIILNAFIMQLVLDIKDIKGDSSIKLRTIPSIIGKEKTIVVVKTLVLLICLGFPFIFSIVLNMLHIIFITLVGAIPLLIYSLDLVKKNNYYGYVLYSMEFIVWGLLVMATSHIYGIFFS